jgi:hypothetical protein
VQVEIVDNSSFFYFLLHMRIFSNYINLNIILCAISNIFVVFHKVIKIIINISHLILINRFIVLSRAY